jgi:2-polyprenyl-3-methyl-5-hydroxy-6-metoxy-1,4-benzoquinol methylase
MDFSIRSTQKELLDAEFIPMDDLYQNLKELAFINTYLGGFAITVAGVAALVKDKNKNYHIVDIGCGGGDNMIAVARWAKKNQFNIRFTGIDMKADAIAYARKNCSAFPEINFIESDYQLSQFNTPVDVIISSLFCHHLTTAQFETCINWMKQHAALGFVINDLERNKIAYYSIKWLTAIFSKSYLVKHDAAVSVSRGFKKNEIVNQLRASEINNYSLSWKWAFRYLVVVKKEA